MHCSYSRQGSPSNPETSTSGSSSPQSSSSTDEEMHVLQEEDSTADCSASMPYYNFSIPDLIKRERIPNNVMREQNRLVSNDSIILSDPYARNDLKRRLSPRDPILSGASNRSITEEDQQHISRSKRRRTSKNTPIDNRPHVIDLTESPEVSEIETIRLFDDQLSGAHSDSEITPEGAEASGDHTPNPARSYDDVVESLECFRRRLQESRETLSHIRHEARTGLARLRRRSSPRMLMRNGVPNVVTDGPLVIPNDNRGNEQSLGGRHLRREREHANRGSVIQHTPPGVINIEEDVHLPDIFTSSDQDHDREIARRMAGDPLFSPPFLTPPNAREQPAAQAERAYESDTETLEELEVRLNNIRRRSRERVEEARRISHEAQQRLQQIRERLQVVSGFLDEDHQPIRLDDSPQHDIIQEQDEVEFIREWRPPHYVGPPSNSIFNWGHAPPRMRRRRSAIAGSPLFPGIPDFLFPYVRMIHPAPPLQHYPSSMTNEEDYEALWSLAERLGPAKPRGLSKTEIDRIPSFRYKPSHSKETNTTCVVCMSEYSTREKLRKMPCSHDFHSKCIDKWLKSNKTCPVCRDEVKI